jgi:CDP-4-dehydro-6-deoxyglucose reductase, E1
MTSSEIVYQLASSSWDQDELNAMQRVIKSGNFTMGHEVREFERKFADYCGTKFAVMSNSGSSANLLAMAAIKYSKKYGKDERDEVIVPAVSWSTTYYPITQLGYKLRFADVDLNSLNATASAIQAAINNRTAGIFAVNLLGNPSDLEVISNLASEAGIFLLEDNCESMGARIGTKFSGTFGQIGTFSSFFSHHISTMEGGLSVTDDEELAQLMTSLRAHGWTRELPETNHVHDKTGEKFDDLFRFVLPGYNLRPLELSGAIGLEQLKKLPAINIQRRLNAEFFKSRIEFEDILIQEEFGNSSWFGFSLILTGKLSGMRSELVSHLTSKGIESRPIVAGNFTRNPVMKHLDHVKLEPLPNADKIHVDGLFVGNSQEDLSKEISILETALREFIEFR